MQQKILKSKILNREFTNKDNSSITYDDCKFVSVIFNFCCFNNVIFLKCSFKDCVFKRCNLNYSQFIDSKIENSSFNECSLMYCFVTNTRFLDTMFAESLLINSKFLLDSDCKKKQPLELIGCNAVGTQFVISKYVELKIAHCNMIGAALSMENRENDIAIYNSTLNYELKGIACEKCSFISKTQTTFGEIL